MLDPVMAEYNFFLLMIEKGDRLYILFSFLMVILKLPSKLFLEKGDA